MDLIRLILACFGIFAYTIYSHHSLILASNIRTNLHKNIQFDANKYMLKEYSLQREYVLQHFLILTKFAKKNIHFDANIYKISTNFTFKRIFACKYLHTSKYLLANICIQANIASNYLGKPFTSLRPQLIFGTF